MPPDGLRARGRRRAAAGRRVHALAVAVLAPDADTRHAAYALEGVAIEVVYIGGPVVIVGGIGSWS